MSSQLFPAPTVGGVIKKVLAINPELNVSQIIALVRQCIEVQGSIAGEFASAEIINEEKVLLLARASLAPAKSLN
jgi:hypothetical protein